MESRHGGGEQTQEKSDSDRPGMGIAGQVGGAVGNQSIGAGGQIRDGTIASRSGSAIHGGNLRLQLKSVQGRKAILQQELRQLDEEELEIRRLLADWEEHVQRNAEA